MLKFEEIGKYFNFVYLYIICFLISIDIRIYKILVKYFYIIYGDICSVSLCNFVLFFFYLYVIFKFICVGVLFGN